MSVVRVGLDVPVAQSYEYRADSVGPVSVGERVLVPFGRRRAVGIVLETGAAATLPHDRLKSVVEVLRDSAPLRAEDLKLLRFAADYYHYPLGQVVMSALPQRLRRVAAAAREELRYEITAAGLRANAEDLPPRAGVKRRVLAQFQAQRALAAAALDDIAPTARAAVKDLIARGWVERTTAAPQVAAAGVEAAAAPRLSPDQARAVETIAARFGTFQPVLLCGVTGSGKTEVYLRLAQTALARGGQVLILVPEIALTPQLEAMVQSRFPDTPLATLHSGLSEGERARNWLAAQAGRAKILLGTRLAVFAPLPDLALVVVDEEHDASFKQTEGFCYSARDLAVVRASQREVPVVLGSATPALESYHNATSGRYLLVEMPERVSGTPPRIECVPIDRATSRDGLAPRLVEAIGAHLARGEQSLVFINRRGYAPVLMCHACGWLSGCHRCSAKLVLHLKARALHCHHCGHVAPVPPACPTCGNPALAPLGQGTQRVEETLRQHFPQARILRIDRDTTRRKNAWRDMRNRIGAREVDILVGTQILAKGHDFPHLALVGVLNADGMLYSADFRAAERLYALLTQVAGRAGRGEAPGEVLIQSEFPDHPLYAALRTQDLHGFAGRLLAERGASGFPPFVYQALLRAEAPQLSAAIEFLQDAKTNARDIADDIVLYDPVPAAMVRLAGRERAQLLVQSPSRPALQSFLRRWIAGLARRSAAARWTLEVDPLEL